MDLHSAAWTLSGPIFGSSKDQTWDLESIMLVCAPALVLSPSPKDIVRLGINSFIIIINIAPINSILMSAIYNNNCFA